MNKVIAIIGVGNIGTRHLQSMQYLKQECEIYAYDLSGDSIEKCRKMCESISDNLNKRINYVDDTQHLPYYLDLVIVATNANVRRDVVEQLINKHDIKYFIFEKVLFQKMKDYYIMQELLKKNNIMAWVNTPRRAFDSYRKLKEDIDNTDAFEIHICGTNWGLGCNLIHYLDCISYLANDAEIQIIDVVPDEIIPKSKREGFYELNGIVIGNAGKCKEFRITSYRESGVQTPATIYVQSEKFRCIIIEDKERIIRMSADRDWDVDIEKFEMPYVSQLSYKLVENILKYGQCNLPTYEISMQEHLPMIKKLIECHFEKLGLGGEICPIT